MAQLTVPQVAGRIDRRFPAAFAGIRPVFLDPERTPAALRRPYPRDEWLRMSEAARLAHGARAIRRDLFDRVTAGHDVVLTDTDRASLDA